MVRLAGLLLVVLAMSVGSAAQEPPPAELRVDVNLVNVTFTVRDPNGALKPNLGREHFTVLEDGAPQKVQLFARENDTPLTLGIVLDFSGSQAGFFEDNIDTAVAFVRSVIRPGDRAFVVAFSLHLKLICDLTSSLPELEDALRNVRRRMKDSPDIGREGRYRGASPIHDALFHSAREKMKQATGRKALLLISDGEDTCSDVSVSDTIEMLQSADTMLYALNNGGSRALKLLKIVSPKLLALKSRLDKITEESGGREFRVKKNSAKEAFREIEEELRTTYAIGYVSSNPAMDGGFRKIEIRTTQPDLKVRARRGYRAQQDLASAR